MTASLDALMRERLHDPTHHYTPEQAQHDRMQELIGLIMQALDAPATKPAPVTADEAHEAADLRDQGLTWREVGERMGISASRAQRAARKQTVSDVLALHAIGTQVTSIAVAVGLPTSAAQKIIDTHRSAA